MAHLIIQTRRITNRTSTTDILIIALEREKATFNTYSMLLNIANMNSAVIETFKLLKSREEEHIKLINEKLTQRANNS